MCDKAISLGLFTETDIKNYLYHKQLKVEIPCGINPIKYALRSEANGISVVTYYAYDEDKWHQYDQLVKELGFMKFEQTEEHLPVRMLGALPIRCGSNGIPSSLVPMCTYEEINYERLVLGCEKLLDEKGYILRSPWTCYMNNQASNLFKYEKYFKNFKNGIQMSRQDMETFHKHVVNNKKKPVLSEKHANALKKDKNLQLMEIE